MIENGEQYVIKTDSIKRASNWINYKMDREYTMQMKGNNK